MPRGCVKISAYRLNGLNRLDCSNVPFGDKTKNDSILQSLEFIRQKTSSHLPSTISKILIQVKLFFPYQLKLLFIRPGESLIKRLHGGAIVSGRVLSGFEQPVNLASK